MENKKVYSDAGFYAAKSTRASFLANLAIDNYVATNTVELRNFNATYSSAGHPLVVVDMYNVEYGTFERTVSVLLDKFPKRINVKTIDVETITGTGKNKVVETKSVRKYLATIVFKAYRHDDNAVAPSDAEIFSNPEIGEFSRFLELEETTETECLGKLTGNVHFSEEGSMIYNHKMNKIANHAIGRNNGNGNRKRPFGRNRN
jgi:hypothetical protein